MGFVKGVVGFVIGLVFLIVFAANVSGDAQAKADADRAAEVGVSSLVNTGLGMLKAFGSAIGGLGAEGE